MNTNQIIKQILVFYTCASVNKTTIRNSHAIRDYAITVSISSPDFNVSGKIVDPVICKSDSTQSYALYIPAIGNKIPLPVIYFFDAHADGALPLKKYKSLADTYGFILIGSNNSKNGNDWPSTEYIWRHLFDDSKNRLKINSNRIYTGGFSGGAKVAGYIALKYPGVKGAIANGAGLPDGSPAVDFNFSFTAVAGEGDMNLVDLLSFNKDLDQTRTRHHIILFNGKHEWAPDSTMKLAFEGLQLDAMQKALIPKDISFINRYVTESKKRLEWYNQTNQLIKSSQEYALSISFLDGLNIEQAKWFKEKFAALSENPMYQKQKQSEEIMLLKEQQKKAVYALHFDDLDNSYWVKTIHDLKAEAEGQTSEKEMCQRLLAYLSLAFYSFSNHLINEKQNVVARHFVELYEMADPGNSEVWYFSALLHARDGLEQPAENDLLKAIELGFRDGNRLKQQPEFQNLFSPTNFSRIESRMHAPVKSN